MTNGAAAYVMKINELACSSLWSIRLLKTTANSISLQLNTIGLMDRGRSDPRVVCVAHCVVE